LVSQTFNGTVGTLSYAYDEMGNLKYAQRDGGTPNAFVYDKNSQLTTFTPAGGSATSYALDATGNRASAGGVSYVSNYLNEYTSVGGRAATYDNNGNVLTRYDSTGASWTYTYDAMNRLKTASNGSTTMNFYYDGLNRQVARNGTGVPATYSVWNGWDLFAEYGYQSSTPIRQTIHGAPGDLVTQTKSGFTTTYYYPDGLGSTVYLASGGGALLEQYTYDAYGTSTIYNASGAQIGVNGIRHLACMTYATDSICPTGAVSFSPARSASKATQLTCIATAPITL
jgi:YD repeat-containing protein